MAPPATPTPLRIAGGGNPVVGASPTATIVVTPRAPLPPPPKAPDRPSFAGAKQWTEQGKDPEEPLQTRAQKQLMYGIDENGPWGMIETVCEVAADCKGKEQAILNANKAAGIVPPTAQISGSWDEVLNDLACNRYDLAVLVYSLPEDVWRAIIRNTLMSECWTKDSKVGEFVKAYMLMSATMTGAGAYTNLLCRTKDTQRITTMGQGPPLYPGRFLSPDQMRELHRKVGSYHDDGANDPFVQRIDNRQSACPLAKRNEHRYQCSDGVVRTFRDRINQLFVGGRPSDVPYKRGLTMVGLTWNIPKRFPQHDAHRGTNALFGLVSAITRNAGDESLELKQLAVLRIHEFKPLLLSLAEILLSIVASSYWYEGGLNPTWAGQRWVPQNLTTSDMSPHFAATKRAVFSRMHILEALREDLERVERRSKIYERHANEQTVLNTIEVVRENADRAEAEEEEARRQRDLQVAENRRLKAELRARVTTSSRSIIPDSLRQTLRAGSAARRRRDREYEEAMYRLCGRPRQLSEDRDVSMMDEPTGSGQVADQPPQQDPQAEDRDVSMTDEPTGSGPAVDQLPQQEDASQSLPGNTVQVVIDNTDFLARHDPRQYVEYRDVQMADMSTEEQPSIDVRMTDDWYPPSELDNPTVDPDYKPSRRRR